MRVVRNKTRRPIQVPLGGGKVLRLGPGKSGNVSPQSTEHPAFVKMLEAGDIEITSGGAAGASDSAPSTSVQGSTHGQPQRRTQRTGDR